MNVRRLSVSVVCMASMATAYAQTNTIVEWSGADPNAYTIYQFDRAITINDPGGHTFKFYAHDSSGDPNTGVINSITLADPNTATGDFSLLIGYPLDPNDPNSPVDPNKPGALHWKAGDLTYDGGTSTILGIHLAGNICGDGEGHHDNIICEIIDGDITVGGSLSEVGPGAPNLRVLQADEITGNITLGGMYGDIETGALVGDVEVGDTWGGRTPGDFRIHSGYAGTMLFTDEDGYVGSIDVEGDFTGMLTVEGVMGGDIQVDDLVVGNPETAPGRMLFLRYVTRSNGGEPPNVHIHGSITGASTGAPAIRARNELGGGGLHGTIAIDGSLYDAISDGPEIVVAEMTPGHRAAIAVDYDGWHANDYWDPNAQILVGDPNDQFETYNGNTPSALVYEITSCRGDIDNTEALDSNDVTAMEDAITYPGEDDFVDAYAGLEGSLWYHGDLDCDGGTDPNDYDLDDYDLEALTFFVERECCPEDCNLYWIARVDIDRDGDVDLGDLAALLAAYGSVTEDPNYNPDADFDDDGDVDLADLAALLGAYGGTWGCSGPGDGDGAGGGGGGEGGEDGTIVTVTVEAYDTHGYQGGGFNGEVDHFVFDLKIEVGDPNKDDWIVTGAVLDASNDATFRLSTTATTPNQYATFVAAPWTSLPGSATADVVGAYDPPDPNEVFTTTDINLGWYDRVSSNDGPATVMRIVIDVSEVDGADVSKGFGSVYFSTSGPTQQEDILVADLASGTSTAYLAPALKSYSGEFYVMGE